MPFVFRPIPALLCGLFLSTATAAELPPGCDTFAWDVSRELAVLQTPQTEITAASQPDHPVQMELNRHYQIHLAPQSEVAFAAPPGKSMSNNGAYAGLVAVQVPQDGRYRVALTTWHWIDLVDDGVSVPSIDYQGHHHHSCPLVHKIVEFELHAGRDLIVQFVGGTPTEVGVAMTAITPPSP